MRNLDVNNLPNRAALKSPWVHAGTAWIYLGLPSYNALYRAIADGTLRIGKGLEVRDLRRRGAQKAIYQVHLDRADDRLETPPDKRAR